MMRPGRGVAARCLRATRIGDSGVALGLPQSGHGTAILSPTSLGNTATTERSLRWVIVCQR